MGRRGEGILFKLQDEYLFVGEGSVSVTILQTMLVVVWSATLCCKLVSFSVKCYWSVCVCECWPVGWIPEIMSGVRG